MNLICVLLGIDLPQPVVEQDGEGGQDGRDVEGEEG